MSLLDPNSDIAAITRIDRNATAALPEAIKIVFNFNCSKDELGRRAADLSYEIAEAMEQRRNATNIDAQEQDQ